MAVKVQSGTTVANTVSTVTFALHYSEVQVTNRGGAGAGDLWFTVDGSTPTVGGNDEYVVELNQTKTVVIPASDQSQATPSSTVVNLISTVATGFTVEGD